VKILGFAHATFANLKDSFDTGHGAVYTFKDISDSPAKEGWLQHDVGLHTIQIYDKPLPLEITSYPNSPLSSVEMVDVFSDYLAVGNEIRSSTFHSEFFNFLTHFSSRAFRDTPAELQINQIAFGRTVKLKYDPFGSPMGEYLDDSSLCGLGFFVDRISIESLMGCPVSNQYEKMSEKFELDLGANRFDILFVRLKGVNIELIARR